MSLVKLDRSTSSSSTQPMHRMKAMLLARSAAGKTSLTTAIRHTAVYKRQPSRLVFSPGNPLLTNSLREDVSAKTSDMQSGGLNSTLKQETHRLTLVNGPRAICDLDICDTVGQLTTLTGTASTDDLKRCEAFMSDLASAQVIVVAVPVLPPDPTSEQRERFGDDITITNSWLFQALSRRGDSPTAIAIVPTKLDIRHQGAEAAREECQGDRFLEEIRPLLETIEAFPSACNECAVIPCSAYGLGNSIPVKAAAPGGKPVAASEPDYMLATSSLQPFGVQTLLTYITLAGLLNQTPHGDAEQPLSKAALLLSSDLAAPSLQSQSIVIPICGRIYG